MKENLVSEQLMNDPRVKEARALLLEATKEHCSKIDIVHGPLKDRKRSYEETIKQFGQKRGGNLWYPYLGSGVGNGALVELADGSVKYDFVSGIGPHYFGHSHPVVIESAIDAAVSDTTHQGNLQQNIDSAKLTDLILDAAKMDHLFLTTSGSVAVENGLKIAFQARYPASRILAFENCFCGRTLGASAISDRPKYREGIPSTLDVDYIPFYDEADPEGSTKRAISALKGHLDRYPCQHATMIFELVQGEGGFYPGSTAFFEAIMTVLKEEKILIIVDEVQSFARTPELFAFHHFNLEKFVDIVTIGKAAQVCGTLFTDAVKPRPGLLSQTFTSSTSAIKSGYAIISSLLEDGYFGPEGKITSFHNYLVQNFENMRSRHPGIISGPYGLGAMTAFTPYDGDAKKAIALTHALYEAGLITFIAGHDPVRIRLLLPVGALTYEDCDEAVAIIEKTLLKG